jgi:integrase
MPRDLKDLKNFKGNDYGSDFILVAVDRKKKVEDIKNLELHEVNVCGYVGDKNETGNRRVPVKLLRLDKLKDGVSQFGQLWDKLEEKKKKARDKASANSSGETLGVESTLHDLIDTFLVEEAWEFKDIQCYRSRLQWWKKHFGDVPLEEVTTSKILLAKNVLKKLGKKPATINRYVSCLQGAFRFGVKSGWGCTCPISNKQVEKDPEEKRVRWLDDDELKKLFKALKSSQSESLEDLVHFSLNTGCRKSEALGLRWKDVDFKNSQIIFRNVKRESVCVNAFINDSGEAEFDMRTQVFEEGLKNKDKMKILKLDNMPKVREILLRRRGNPELVSKSEYVFPQDPRQGWEKLLKRIGLEDFRWHDLRHCCASYMRQDGLSLGHIGNHLGHKSSASTERYSHLSAEETLETGKAVSKRLYG